MKPQYVIVHHSAVADSPGLVPDWDAIRRFHTSWRSGGDIVTPQQAAALRAAGRPVLAPWRSVGYHYGIERVGAQVVLQVGRAETETGAHCLELGMNSRSLGVCVVGDYDTAAPDADHLAVLLPLVRGLLTRYTIPKEHVLGHREVGLLAGFDWKKGQFKSCPGRAWNLDDLRASL